MIRNEPDPYLSYRYRVEITGIEVAGFSEVSGLERTMSPDEHQEGGTIGYTHSLPTRFEHPNLVLKRGLGDYTELWEWLDGVATKPVPMKDHRKDVLITLLDAAGDATWQWQCKDAYPVAWSGPELTADQGSVAIASLELTHKGLQREEGSP